MIVIAGAGGLGKEVADTAMACSLAVRGYLDDGTPAPGMERLGPCAIEAIPAGDELIVAVGDPITRFHLTKRLAKARFASLVHPTAVVSRSATIGIGVFVGPFAYVGPDAIVDDHSLINVYAAVGHDAHLHTGAVLSPYANLNGGASAGVGAFLGTGAVVTVGVQLGAWSKVAANSTVMRDTEPGMLLAGSPAKGRRMFRQPK